MIRKSVLLVLVLFSPGLAICLAQIVTGSISGAVYDQSGSVIPEASVTLVRVSTGLVRQTSADTAGNFQFGGLEAGEYVLKAGKTGFKNFEQRGLMLSTGERISVGRLTLELGAVTETVSVTADLATVQIVGSDRGDLISGKQIEDLLVRGRSVTDLVQLIPGVVMDDASDELGASTQFNVQGSRVTMNNISVDGVPATDMGNGFAQKIVVSQSAVREVRVLISNYQAEYGRMAGSNIQVVTKSGTRSFHGEGAYFMRREWLNANNFFDNRLGLGRQPYRFNTLTYSVGGPVYLPGKFNRNRDKLFFFWQQEYWPTTRSVSGQVTTPTELERAGDFSQTVDLNNRPVTVRDPYTAARSPFPGNVIPASRISSDGQALLRIFPLPNYFDRAISAGRYNYVFAFQNKTPRLAQTAKLDYNINANNILNGGFSYYKEDRNGHFHGNWPQMPKVWTSRPRSLSTRYTRIISPALLNEFSFGWLNQPADDTLPPESLRANQRETVGFHAGQLDPASNPLGIVPNATFGGVTGAAALNTEGRVPLFNRYHLLNWSDHLTWTRGNHTFKAGAYVEWFHRKQKRTVTFNGAFNFGTNANNPLNTGWAYANALLGTFNSYTETSQGLMRLNCASTEIFAQDTWKPFARLTIDYGLRIYWVSPINEKDDQMAGFVLERYDPSRPMQLIGPTLVNGKRAGIHPVTGEVYPDAAIGAIAPGAGTPYNGMVVAAQDKSYPRAMVNPAGANWGPRFGFAYDVFGTGSTTLRGGFGIFFDRYNDLFTQSFVGQPPLMQSPVINYGEIARLLTSGGMIFPANTFAADPAGKLPKVMNFSFSVQRRLPGATTLDAGYAGSLGRHLQWRRDLNAVPLGTTFNPAYHDPTRPGTPLPNAFLVPIPGYGNINQIEPAGSSNYHSLQVNARRRFSRGVQFGAAWTWSKTLNYNDTNAQTVTSLVPVRVWNYGLAAFDRTHVFALNYLLDVPKIPIHNAVARGVLHGWQLSGITRFVSGAPRAVTFTGVAALDYSGTPSLSPRIKVLSNPVLPKSERSFSRNFRTEAFSLPDMGTLGNAARTVIRGPGINNWDAALFKNFPLRERVRLQFRVELYNIFNHTQFSALDTQARFDARNNQINARFSEFTAARNPRQMQLALRLTF